jgi:pyruvate dehydrogenase E2 component (dihydrolipoamide acetyltransferase)
VSTSIEVKVPDIGDFRNIPVIEVLVSPGDRVEAEDSLVTLESDKATMEVPAPRAGVIRELRLRVNDTVSEGDVVAILEVESAAVEPPPSEAPPAEPAATRQTTAGAERQLQPQPAAKPTAQPVAQAAAAAVTPSMPPAGRLAVAAVDPSAVPYASPAVRKFARELGVDLSQVKGSGDNGRILSDDVAAYVKSVIKRPPAEQARPAGFDLPAPPVVDFSRFGTVTQRPLSRIRRLSAGFLHRNWIGIPHVTQHDEADITDMEAFRKSLAADAARQGFKLTPLVFLIKASVMALKQYPEFNASLDASGENLVLKSYFHIGIAVDTPEGLVVPVLRDCERKGIMELARELHDTSARAREKKLKPDDIQGGCFSISSLGGIGGTGFTPIINAPEVAILGVSRSAIRPVWDGDKFQPRLMLPLSLSYDHRVIDGAAAARFARYLASQLEDIRRLTL